MSMIGLNGVLQVPSRAMLLNQTTLTVAVEYAAHHVSDMDITVLSLTAPAPSTAVANSNAEDAARIAGHSPLRSYHTPPAPYFHRR